LIWVTHLIQRFARHHDLCGISVARCGPEQGGSQSDYPFPLVLDSRRSTPSESVFLTLSLILVLTRLTEGATHALLVAGKARSAASAVDPNTGISDACGPVHDGCRMLDAAMLGGHRIWPR
jgi:hypothetical protein